MAIACILFVLLLATPVASEPVSTFIGLTALIAGTTGVSVAIAGAIGGFIVSSAISIGISFVTASLSKKSDGSGSADTGTYQYVNAPETRLSTRQSAPPKRIIFGEGVQVGGALCFEQVKPPYLYRTYLINEGEIGGITGIYVGTEKLAFNSLQADTILTPIGIVDQADYPGNLQICIGLGRDDQGVCPLLAANFPEIDPSFRQRGIARVTVKCRSRLTTDPDLHEALWGMRRDPNFFFVCSGVKMFDPRDATQFRDDASTWKTSNNSSIVQAHYTRAEYGGRIPPHRIDYRRVARAADWDDGLIVCKNGDRIRRHTCDGMILLNQQPFDVLQAMLTSNRGSIVQSGGMFWPTSSAPKEPVLTVRDSIIVGGIDYRNDKPKRDQLNTFQWRFIADEREYNLADGPPLILEVEKAADGEALPVTLDLKFTRDHRRGQRIVKAFAQRARLGRTISCPIDIVALAEAIDDPSGAAIVVEDELFPMINGLYEANTMTFLENFSALQIDGFEYDPSIETDWDATVDEKDFEVADIDVS